MPYWYPGPKYCHMWYLHQYYYSFFYLFLILTDKYCNLHEMNCIHTYLLKHTNFSLLSVTWFLTYILSNHDPLLFSNFNSYESPPMKYWMVWLSHHWVLYFTCSGRGVFSCLQYEALFFNLARKDNIKGIFVTREATIHLSRKLFLLIQKIWQCSNLARSIWYLLYCGSR